MQSKANKCLFVWENLGPTHVDRLRACVAAGIPVSAIQFAARSGTYSWTQDGIDACPVVTLSPEGRPLRGWRLAKALLQAVLRNDAKHVFLCHYSEPAVIMAAFFLRTFTRRRIWLMADSKFDDFPRRAIVERVKALILTPYHGAIVASDRSKAYFASLGIHEDLIAQGYDTIDIARIRS